MTGSYDYRLVALSVVIAICASYAALDLAGRTRRGRSNPAGLARRWRLRNGLGDLVDALHRDAGLQPAGASFLRLANGVAFAVAAIFASAVALFVVSRQKMGLARALAGSVIMGSGISVMHYTGMAAMRLPAMCSYDPCF